MTRRGGDDTTANGRDRGREQGDSSGVGRRWFLRSSGAAAGAALLAGCSSSGNGSDGNASGSNSSGNGSTGNGSSGNGTGGSDNATTGGNTTGNATASGPLGVESFRGSGPLVESRPPLDGTRIAELPDLSGTLSIYLGGGEGGLYTEFLDLLGQMYPDFNVELRTASSAQLANTLITEVNSGSTNADVFWAIDVGALGVVADNDATVELPTDVVEPVPESFRPDNQWVGVAGRARSVPFNTDTLSADQIPNKVQRFTDAQPLEGSMGWAPTYGSFQSFITAMRLLRGEQGAKSWLRGMQQQGISEYPDEFLISNAVADGELAAGFANHYYTLRVKAARPDAPIELAFTKGDAGALINAAGVEIVKGTQRRELATNFIRHLLTAEAQEFFATRTFAYPMVPGVPPVGGLPTIDELNPPQLDLAKLSNLEPTLTLMREVGVL
ncbi:extracellular solute-binding protein [Halococcus saccharolyticus]|uniref:extracellular solute-binding protein n=1 Tax=Halococcus saccharolyticus TaxID=62319 RepID=UPI0040402CF9